MHYAYQHPDKLIVNIFRRPPTFRRQNACTLMAPGLWFVGSASWLLVHRQHLHQDCVDIVMCIRNLNAYRQPIWKKPRSDHGPEIPDLNTECQRMPTTGPEEHLLELMRNLKLAQRALVQKNAPWPTFQSKSYEFACAATFHKDPGNTYRKALFKLMHLLKNSNAS